MIAKDIDHIGYAVKDMASSLQVFSKLGYTFSPVKLDEYRNVNVCIASKGGGKTRNSIPFRGHKVTYRRYFNQERSNPLSHLLLR